MWKRIHAEEDLVRKLIHKNPSFSKFTILVMRLGRSGRFLMARPCPTCLQMLTDLQTKKILFTNNEGQLEQLHP